jgi:hypothetical protein
MLLSSNVWYAFGLRIHNDRHKLITSSTDENNNLINNSIDLLDELNCSTNDDHSIYMLVSESDHEDLSEIQYW